MPGPWRAGRCPGPGERDGARALIEVLLRGRHVSHEHLVAGLASALRAGALSADAVALEARKLRTFDFEADGNIDAAVIHALATCERGKKACRSASSATPAPASPTCSSRGTEAAMAGFRVRYTLATELVNEPVEAADEKTLTETIARSGRVDPLCTDELGYMELDRRGAELLFLVLTEREEKNSVAIASNESFGGWTRTFTDPRLCAAIVNRLAFGGDIIETGTESYLARQHQGCPSAGRRRLTSPLTR
ncbi:ATP-binding protein [Streptomyces sp. NPDC004009]